MELRWSNTELTQLKTDLRVEMVHSTNLGIISIKDHCLIIDCFMYLIFCTRLDNYFLTCILCSYCFVLTVMGSFEEGERSQSVSQGDGAVIPAPRIRSFPQPQVTWYRDGRKIPPGSRM